MKKILLGILFGLALSLALTVASAHDPKVEGKPKHGGQYVMFEKHFGIEMVASADELTFYMTEHLEPMDMTESSFKAVVQTDADTRMLPLVANGDRLTTKLDSELPAGAKVALTGKISDGHAIQARFVKK